MGHSKSSGSMALHVLLLATALPAQLPVCQAQIVAAGKGSYTTSLTEFDPSDHGTQFNVYIADDAPYPYPTSDWWTSVLTQPFSQNLFAFPLAFRCDADGLQVDRPQVRTTEQAVITPFQADFTIGAKGEKYARALAEDWSDFTVDILFANQSADWTATIGHGLPFAYATFRSGTPVIRFHSPPRVIRRRKDALHIRLENGQEYGIFYIAKEAVADEEQRQFTFSDGTYLSVAAVPKETEFNTLHKAAFQHVTDSRVEYSYDMQAGHVTTEYRIETQPVQGDSSPGLLTLFPHHYERQEVPETVGTYESLRGQLRVIQGNRFTTVEPFHGVLPYLPEPVSDGFNVRHLHQLLDRIADKKELFTSSTDPIVAELMKQGNPAIKPSDTYFGGKQIAHIARLIPIADQSKNTRARDTLLRRLREQLVDWFTAIPGEKDHYFFYDRRCGGLIGMNSGFFTYDFTDHHFHYGHFVYAAAIVSLYDQQFRTDYGPMVELLIHDYNSPKRDHKLLPHLRMMDAYEGHCWANGAGGHGDGDEDDGNDQESSSEAMHAWEAIILWGMVTGDEQLRDHGIWGYVTEAAATRQYYFDVDNDIYPNDAEFQHNFVSLLLGGRASHPGYFDFKEYVYGIQFIPITPGSMYLSYDLHHAKQIFADFRKEKGGLEDRWFDNMWMFEAFSNPQAVLNRYDESVALDFDGNSFANVYNWVHFFNGAGNVDVSVQAAWPHYGVFRSSAELTLTAFNPTADPVSIPFTGADGERIAVLRVPPGELSSRRIAIRKPSGVRP